MKLMTWMKSAATAAAMMLAGMASAEWAPSGTLKLQIGFGAGGSTDTIGRVVAQVMKEQTGWNVIAENKPGGGGVAMFTAIANRPADGSIVGLGVNMPLFVNLVNRPEQMKFDLDSFDYLGTAGRAQLALVARGDAPFDDIDGLIAAAKDAGGAPIAFGAKPQELLMRFISKQAGVDFQFLSTKGGAESSKLLLGGQALASFASGEHLPFLESGDVKMLASVNNVRHSYAPDTPTAIEQGYDIYVDPVYFFATTAGTPDEARSALAAALAAALDSDEVKTVVQNALQSPIDNLGPDGTAEMMKAGLVNTGKLFGK
ncbi:tripartite tricarboxylate transporter substrate binding protein [Marimonas lutisalis]|uniref:tripartite tricarboxylate transporter substrate binding protein n=1 Tax=Marimonas lutisalis TaxID=2545756 RepID=UPI0010F9CE4E|nr:tripartite tricarboxylate transporter substrate binding protein [Marimonas lutisalis]